MSKFELRNTTFPLGIIHRNSILLPQSSEFSVRKLKGKVVFLIFLRQILISDDQANLRLQLWRKNSYRLQISVTMYLTNTRKIKKNILVFRCYDGPTLLIYLTTKNLFEVILSGTTFERCLVNSKWFAQIWAKTSTYILSFLCTYRWLIQKELFRKKWY